MAVMAAMASPDHVPEHRPPPPTKSLRQQTPIKLAMSKTPRRDNLTMTRTPYATGLPKDHVYPSTAPLPHLPTFLGSPFSTKTPRGKYVYDTTSPSKGVMTERGGQNVFEQMGLDWLGRSEWMADEANDVEERFETEIEPEHQPTVLPRRSSRSRREASGSTSSLDDFSGSGTSSASLLSLGRTSGEYHVRPNIVTIWRGEEDDLDHEDVDPATPSRQSLAVTNDTDGTLPMSAKTARQSPGLSPQSGKKTSLKSPAGQVSPVQQFHLSLSPSDCAAALYQPPPSAAKATRSPLSNFLPRLLSSAKEDNDSAKGTKTSRPPRLSAQAVRELEVVMTDTEDNGSETSHSNGRPLRGSPLHRGYIEGTENADLASSFGSGIGLGIQQSVEPAAMLPLRSLGRTTPFSRSASSESSSEIDPSPSKFLSARASAAQLSPSLSTAFTPPIILTRRKTMAFPAKVSTKSSPAASFARPRPVRPLVRRGITEPRAVTDHTIGTPTNGLLTVRTPFADIKPSPAAFASTGLVRKKSGVAGIDLPKFGQATEPLRPLKSLSPIKLPSLISAKDVSNPLRAAQKTRGLRRKGSTMLTIGPSGSIGDVVKTDCTFSPATPTKPTFRGKSLSYRNGVL